MAPPLSSGLLHERLERHDPGRSSSGCPMSAAGPLGEPAFSDLQYREVLMGLRRRLPESLAVYVHVPFCHVRCLYCACNTTVTHSEHKVDRYLDALDTEMSLVTDLVGRQLSIDQLHVGGGTPNHLSEPQLARLMAIVERHFRLAPQARASIECNPRRTSAGQLDLLHGLGFRSISFGVQDLNADVQRAIGRMQSFDMVRDVFLTARETGFESIGLDLIYGLPFQTARSFQTTVEQVVALEPDRVACFPYTHDPVRRPHQHAIASERLPTDEEKQALFRGAVRAFAEAGYLWVGLDVFVRQHDELCNALAERRLHRNVIGYTSMPVRPVLAFGPSGIGEIEGVLTQNEADLQLWQQHLGRGRLPVAWEHRLSEAERRRRAAVLHLMCNLELPASLASGLGPMYERLCRSADYGLVEVTADGLRVTPEGRYLLRKLCLEQDASFDWDGAARWPGGFAPAS